MGRDGGCIAGSPARPRRHGDPDRRVRGLLRRVLVGARGHVADDGQVHDVLFRMYGIYNVVFGLMASAIAVTAFRRGDRWAWWALLVGNTIAFVSAITYDWIVNAIGPFELTEYLGLALIWGALAVTAPFRRSGTAGSIDGLTRSPGNGVRTEDRRQAVGTVSYGACGLSIAVHRVPKSVVVQGD